MNKKHLLFFLACLSLFSQCNNKKNSTDKPESVGRASEIIVVIDTTLWKGDIGAAIRDVYRKPLPGLPQTEPIFSVHRVSPFQYNNFLKIHRNLIFVTVLGVDSPANNRVKGFLAPDLQNKISSDTSMYHIVNKDQHAKYQTVMYLFGATKDQLIKSIKNNEAKLREPFIKAELDRLAKDLYSKNENKKLASTLQKEHGISMRIPAGYQQAKSEKNFVWLRNYGKVDKNIIVAYKDYTSQDQFTAEKIMAWRDSIGANYVFGSGQKDTVSYMITQDYIPVETQPVNFNGTYGIEARGMWMLKNESMGGTFLSYTFVDEAQKRIYYIEGFIYAPSEDKREPMREIEAVLKTVKIENKKAA